ncbi:MAG: hypothetical protein HKN01_01515 [Acidimicrobiia bacterium]|nr:hypothetical protein [Acidimicrobiia bacterium]
MPITTDFESYSLGNLENHADWSKDYEESTSTLADVEVVDVAGDQRIELIQYGYDGGHTSALWLRAEASFPDDQYAEFVKDNNDVGMFVTVRGDSAGDGYLGLLGGGVMRSYRIDTGTITQLTSSLPTTAAGDSVRLEATGTTIRVRQNAGSWQSTTDATHASGKPGICTNGTTAGNGVQADDWECTDATAANEDFNALGIASTVAFGTMALTEGNVDFDATGIAPTTAFGTMALTEGNVDFDATGIAPTTAFGVMSFSGATEFNALGIAPTTAFGAMSFTTGNVDFDALGIAPTTAFGAMSFSSNVDFDATGIAPTTAFGAMSFTAGNVNFDATGIAPTTAFGVVDLQNDVGDPPYTDDFQAHTHLAELGTTSNWTDHSATDNGQMRVYDDGTSIGVDVNLAGSGTKLLYGHDGNYGDAQYAEVERRALSGILAGPAVWCQTGGNGVFFQGDGTDSEWGYVINGSFTAVEGGGSAIATGDIQRIEIDAAGNVTCKINDVVEFTGTVPGTVAVGGDAGLSHYTGSAGGGWQGVRVFDNFEGGNLAEEFTAVGIAPTTAFGTMALTEGNVDFDALGIAPTTAFGTMAFSQPGTFSANGIAPTTAFGTMSFTTGNVDFDALGIAPTTAFGTMAFGSNENFDATGIASTTAFGVMAFTVGNRDLTLLGIAPTTAFGAMTFSGGVPRDPTVVRVVLGLRRFDVTLNERRFDASLTS